MPITYTADEIASLESEFTKFVGFIRIATPIPVHLWTGGPGDFPIMDSAFDPDGTLYKGSRVLDVPTFERIWNGLAERITVTLTGVTDDMRDAVYEEADDVRGAIVRMGFSVLDGDWQQLGPVRWLRRGRVDVIETHNTPGQRERIKTIAFSLGSQLTGRRVPGSGSWTNGDQKSRPGSDDDRFCERTSMMTQTTEIVWPNF
jgi:hypothetical protein